MQFVHEKVTPSRNPGGFFESRNRWIVAVLFVAFLFLLLLCSRYELNLDRGWYLTDSGIYYTMLATAEGHMPYADFMPRYTPGLYYLNALLFNTFGVRMSVVRYSGFSTWLASIWWPAR